MVVHYGTLNNIYRVGFLLLLAQLHRENDLCNKTPDISEGKCVRI